MDDDPSRKNDTAATSSCSAGEGDLVALLNKALRQAKAQADEIEALRKALADEIGARHKVSYTPLKATAFLYGRVPPPRIDAEAPTDSPKPRDQQLARKFADEEFPYEWRVVPTVDIINRCAYRFTDMGLNVPSRSTWERALGRRLD